MTTRRTADTSKTNFTHDFRGETEERHAYQEVLDYLVNTGRYPDATEADNDAMERVRFCEEINLYADDPRLKDASVQQRKIHALIHSHNLQAVITENNGYLPMVDKTVILPSAISAGEGDSTAAASSATDHGLLHDPLLAAPRRSENDLAAALPETKKVVTKKAATKKVAMKKAVAETAAPPKENTFLQVTGYISKASIIVAVMLASSVFFFHGDVLLQVTKYTFFLFFVMMIAAIGLSEVSSRLMLRLRYAVGYLSLIASASLSGLLFLQQPWAESAFTMRGGLSGVLLNFLIERVVAIGPFWLGVFFAVVASVFLVTTWQAGRKIRDNFSSGR